MSIPNVMRGRDIDETKRKVLAAIEVLKKDKPEHWHSDVRQLLAVLRELDDPFREHVCHGTEGAGRHNRGVRIKPTYDKMGDNSWP